MPVLTLNYLRDNPDLTEAGYQFGEQMSLFVDQAAEADYTCDDGDNLQEAVDLFWEAANKIPQKIYDRLGSEKGYVAREVVLTLFNPKSYIDRYDRKMLEESLAAALTKDELVEAFEEWGTACNEYFRLRWLVVEHGGWRKDGAR